MKRSLILLLLLILSSIALADEVKGPKPKVPFNPEQDLLSLHYDHAPDRDDGHSAVADRMILESMFRTDWLNEHVIAVSGAYGINAAQFQPESDAVMRVTWDDSCGWKAAAENWEATVTDLAEQWSATLKAGGDVWVKEGGQSDLTADVVREIQRLLPDVDTNRRIHVVQHSNWNEDQTRKSALACTKANTDYLRIRDANSYLNIEGGDEPFIRAAASHPKFGRAWQAAFQYYDPQNRLDFSDTGELLYILGLGELGIDQVRQRFLATP